MPQTIEQVLTARKQQDPNYRLPAGYRWDGVQVTRGPGTNLGGVPGAGGSTGINIPLGGGEGTPTIGSGVPSGFPGAQPVPGMGATGGGSVPGSSGITDSIMDYLGNPSNWATLLEVFGDVGGVAGSAAAGAAQGRATEADLLSRRDLAANQQYGINQNAEMNAGSLDLARKNFSENARGGRAKQAIVGNLLNNMQDVNISVPGVQGSAVGGIRPSAIGSGGRANAAELARQATVAQLQGDTFTGGDVLEKPTLSSIPEASGWETAAGAAGTIGSLAAALAPLLRRRQPTTPAGAGPSMDGV